MDTPRTDIDWVRHRLDGYQPRRLPADGHNRAAVAVMLRPDEADCQALFIKRAEHPRDPWSGHIGLPGGRVEGAEESPLTAVLREVREEVAIDLERSGQLVASFDEIVTTARGRVSPLIISPYVFALTEDVQPVANEKEVQRLLWVPVSELLDPAATSTCHYTHAGDEVVLPCFRVADQVIWGLTYHIVTRLFSVLSWGIGTL